MISEEIRESLLAQLAYPADRERVARVALDRQPCLDGDRPPTARVSRKRSFASDAQAPIDAGHIRMVAVCVSAAMIMLQATHDWRTY